MAVRNSSSVVSFDADAALEAAREAVEGPLYSFVEFDREAYNAMYVAEETLGFDPDRERMDDHFARIHSHARLDFTEIELFTEELFPIADGVEYIVTAMDYLTLVRIYAGREGVFIALGPDEPVEPVVAAVEEIVGRSREAGAGTGTGTAD